MAVSEAGRPLSSAASSEPPPWLDEAPPEHEVVTPSTATEVVSAGALQPRGLSTTALGDRWAEAVRTLITRGSIAALVRELALQAELIAVQSVDGLEHWHLRVEREALRAEALRERLQGALQTALNAPLRLLVEAGKAEDSVSLRDAQSRAAAQQEAEQAIRHDPTVRELMAQFTTARIVPGSIKPNPDPRNDAP